MGCIEENILKKWQNLIVKCMLYSLCQLPPQVFIAVVVTLIIYLLNTLYFYYEIHLKYCQDMDAYGSIKYLL
jgi:hypothetical protein